MRNEILARPALLAAVGLVSGLATFFNPLLVLIPLSIGSFCAQVRATVILVLFFGLGYSLAKPQLAGVTLEKKYLRTRMNVVSLPTPEADGWKFIGEIGSQQFYVRTRTRFDVGMGDEIEFQGWQSPLSEISERTWRDRGVSAQIKISSPPAIVRQGPALGRIGPWLANHSPVREPLVKDEDEQAEIDALVFGERNELPISVQQRYRYAGLSALLGDTGAKIGLFALLGSLLIPWVPLPRWISLAILFSALLIHALAVGLTASEFRALGMLALLFFAPTARRSFDGLTALSLVIITALLIDPRLIWAPGFQMSVAAILSMCLVGPMMVDSRGSKERWLYSLKMAIAVSLGSLPLAAYHFHFLPLAGVITSVMVTPVYTVFAGATLGATYLPLARWFLVPLVVQPSLRLIDQITDNLSQRALFIPVPPFSGYLLLLILASIILLWKPKVRRA